MKYSMHTTAGGKREDDRDEPTHLDLKPKYNKTLRTCLSRFFFVFLRRFWLFTFENEISELTKQEIPARKLIKYHR